MAISSIIKVSLVLVLPSARENILAQVVLKNILA